MPRQQKTNHPRTWLPMLTRYWEVLVLFVLSWTPFFWYGNEQIVLGHDSGYRLNMWEYLKSLWFSWNPTLGFGADWTINKGFLITQLPEVLFTQLTGSLSIGQRLSFVLWFFLIGLGMYLFTRRFFAGESYRILRLTASIMYMYNFFLLQGWFITERAKFSLFAALPVGLVLAYEAFVEGKHVLRNAILFAFLFFVCNGGSSPPLFGAVLVTYALTWLYGVWISVCAQKGKQLLAVVLKKISVAVVFLVPLTLLNAYWIIPQASLLKQQYSSSLTSIGGIEEILAWERVVSASASFANLFRLQGIPDWYDMPSHTYSAYFLHNPGLIVLSFLPIALIALGLVFRDRFKDSLQQRQLFLLIALLCIVSIFFTAGSHPPLGGLYAQFIRHVPGFAMFRSSIYKFGPAFWFSFIFLASYSLNNLLISWQKYTRYAPHLLLASISLILFYHFPFFKAHFFRFNPPFSTKLTVPTYVPKMREYVDARVDEQARMVLVPELYRDFPVDSYRWGFWSFDLFPRLVFQQSVVANASIAPDAFVELYDALDIGDQQRFLALSRIFGLSHVLWRGDTLYHDKQTTAAEKVSQRNALRAFDGVSFLHQEGAWELYEIATPSALFQLSHQLIVDDEALPLASIITEPALATLSASIIPQDTAVSAAFPVGRVIAAKCLHCSTEQTPAFTVPDHLPYVRFLPDHPLYGIIRLKEQLQLRFARNTPQRSIDLQLVMMGKRLRELLTLSEKNARTEETSQRFVDQVSSTNLAIQALPPAEQLVQQQRLVAILMSYQPFLENSAFQRARDQNARMIAALSQKISESNDRRKDVSPILKQYTVDIPESAGYRVAVIPATSSLLSVDGVRIDLRKPLQLEKGAHQFDLQLASELIAVPLSPRPPLLTPESIRDDQRLFSSSTVDAGRYILTFDYRIPDRSQVKLSVQSAQLLATGSANKMNTVLLEHLDPRSEWTTYRKSLTLPDAAAALHLSFPQDESVGTQGIEVKNLQLTKDITPQIQLSVAPNGDGEITEAPRFIKKNPTAYEVDVNVSQPTLLVFRQSFHPGWRVYPADTSWFTLLFSRSLAADSHILVDRYANGWFIDSNTPSKLLIVYWPQRVFEASVVISVITAGVLVGVLLVSRKKADA